MTESLAARVGKVVDKFQRALDEFYPDDIDEEYHGEVSCWSSVLTELRAIAQELRGVGWVKVEDGCAMPEDSRTVQIAFTNLGEDRHIVTQGYYSSKMGWFNEIGAPFMDAERFGSERETLTHWRELPEPPESEAGDD